LPIDLRCPGGCLLIGSLGLTGIGAGGRLNVRLGRVPLGVGRLLHLTEIGSLRL
jgi:hypothetical protein